ncbi:MAG: nucleoside monophosphate kinase [bacterium]
MEQFRGKVLPKTAVITLGKIYSGATTQAKILAEEYDFYHVSTSAILRDLAKQKDQRGIRIKAILESGQYVPDTMMMELLSEVVSKQREASGFVFDWYPRTIQQKLMLVDMFKRLKIDIRFLFVELNVSQAELARRKKNHPAVEKTPKETHDRASEFEKTEHLIYSLKEKERGSIVTVNVPDHASPADVFVMIQQEWARAYVRK